MIKVSNLTKKYGDFTAVDNLSFEIRDREVVGLLGPNGAGKSTTMRMLTGYLNPSSGTISISGTDLKTDPLSARKKIGYLPEIPPLYPDLTVREQLGFVCDLHGLSPELKSGRIDEVCRQLSIDNVSGRLISHLSKGYRQRVGFASALVGEPEFLILDEPTVGLDPAQIREIRSLISELSKSMSILISSHILSEISSVCNSLVIIRQGKLVAKGSLDEIESSVGRTKLELLVKGSRELLLKVLNTALPGIYIESSETGDGCVQCLISEPKGRDIRPAVFKALSDNSGKLTLLSMRSVGNTLEDVFLELTAK